MLEVVWTSICKSATEQAVKVLGDAFKRENKEGAATQPQFISTENLTRNAIFRHVEVIKRWATFAAFADLDCHKSISQIYVEIDTYLVPLRRHAAPVEKNNVRPLLQALTEAREHIIVTGGAGAGKTTALKKICLDYFSKGKALLNYNFPILIQLRDLSESSSCAPLIEKIQEILSIQVNFPENNREGIISHETKAALSKT